MIWILKRQLIMHSFFYRFQKLFLPTAVDLWWMLVAAVQCRRVRQFRFSQGKLVLENRLIKDDEFGTLCFTIALLFPERWLLLKERETVEWTTSRFLIHIPSSHNHGGHNLLLILILLPRFILPHTVLIFFLRKFAKMCFWSFEGFSGFSSLKSDFRFERHKSTLLMPCERSRIKNSQKNEKWKDDKLCNIPYFCIISSLVAGGRHQCTTTASGKRGRREKITAYGHQLRICRSNPTADIVGCITPQTAEKGARKHCRIQRGL